MAYLNVSIGGSCVLNTVEPGYNDVGLCDKSSIDSDILWYELIPRC
jgi:hypothetical protein